jgi:hypothetical protein
MTNRIITATDDKIVAQALYKALQYYMSQYGQALEAHGIALGDAQETADKDARAALNLYRNTYE